MRFEWELGVQDKIIDIIHACFTRRTWIESILHHDGVVEGETQSRIKTR